MGDHVPTMTTGAAMPLTTKKDGAYAYDALTTAETDGPEPALTTLASRRKSEGAVSPSKEPTEAADETPAGKIAVTLSWIANVALLVVKLYLFIVTGSKSVLAALADSVVDLVSQALMSYAEWKQAKWDDDFPVGRFRLEALAVLGCGVIMSVANLEVVQFSIHTLYQGIKDSDYPDFNTSWYIYTIMGVCIFSKLLLWKYCTWAMEQSVIGGDILEALSEDHLNDVMSNSAAVGCLAVAAEVPDDHAWWVDASGAILISLYIIYRWMEIGQEQVQKIVGLSAPAEWITTVEDIAKGHDQRVRVDCTRAYHVGARYCVEMEIVLPELMTVRESHDLALTIQHKIEELPECERAFVHVDHAERDGLEHKPERELITGSEEVTSPGPENLDPQFKSLKQRKPRINVDV